MTRRDRYPGARPFADDPIDQRLYFGRPREAEELFHRVLADPLLVIYGKSGLGKTSLLQAGVFPRLRERDLLPVPVRLNRPEVSPLDAVREALEWTCQTQGIDAALPAADDLWTLFKSVAPWRGEALQTPVLVLDQFEEVFTLHPPEGRRRWARAIAELVGGRPPESIREHLRAGERLPFGEGPPAVKLILCLREDHLGGLEELVAEVPAVLENRLRLTALSREAARAAIRGPAGLPQGEDLASPPLDFTEAALTGLLDFLEGKSLVIEPFQLQVLCHHLERQAAAKAPGGAAPVTTGNTTAITIEAAALGGPKGMAAVLAGFYRDALADLPGWRERRRARNLCEWGLLSRDGRRLPMDSDEARRQFGVAPQTLQRLVDARLLRVEPRLEGLFYELSHDTLAESALANRRWRLPRGLKYGLAALALLLAGTLVVLRITEDQRRRADLARAEAEGLIEFMLFDLRDKLQPIGRLDLLKGVNDRVDSYYRQLGVDAKDSAMQRRRAVALINRGTTLQAQGDLPGALAAYEEGLVIFKRLAAVYPGNWGWQRDLSVGLKKVADVKAAQGDLGGALAGYEEALAICKRLAAADPSNTGWQGDLAASLVGIADIKAAQGDLGGALAGFEEALTIYKRLAASDPSNTSWQKGLLVSLGRISNSKMAQADLGGALAAYEQGNTIVERLTASDPSNTGWQRDLSVGLVRIANIKAAQGDLDGARAAYEEANLIRERLAGADPSNVQWQLDLASSLVLLGNDDLAKPEAAAGYLRRALGVLRLLEVEGKLNPKFKHWPDMIRSRLLQLEMPIHRPSPKPPSDRGKEDNARDAH